MRSLIIFLLLPQLAFAGTPFNCAIIFTKYLNSVRFVSELEMESLRQARQKSLKFWQGVSGLPKPRYLIKIDGTLANVDFYLNQRNSEGRDAIFNMLGETFRAVEYAYHAIKLLDNELAIMQGIEGEILKGSRNPSLQDLKRELSTSTDASLNESYEGLIETLENEGFSNLGEFVQDQQQKLTRLREEHVVKLAGNIDLYDWATRKFLRLTENYSGEFQRFSQGIFDGLGDRRAWKRPGPLADVVTMPATPASALAETHVKFLHFWRGRPVSQVDLQKPENLALVRPSLEEIWGLYTSIPQAQFISTQLHTRMETRAAILAICLHLPLVRWINKSALSIANRIPVLREQDVVKFANYLTDHNARFVQSPRIVNVVRASQGKGTKGAASAAQVLNELFNQGATSDDRSLLIETWERWSGIGKLRDEVYKVAQEKGYNSLVAEIDLAKQKVKDRKLTELSNVSLQSGRNLFISGIEFSLVISSLLYFIFKNGIPAIGDFFDGDDENKDEEKPKKRQDLPTENVAQHVVEYLDEKARAGDEEAKVHLQKFREAQKVLDDLSKEPGANLGTIK